MGEMGWTLLNYFLRTWPPKFSTSTMQQGS